MNSSSEDTDKPHNKSPDFHGVKGIFRLNVWIPTESVGKVIGKKGAVITHIQRQTQTEVVVLPLPPDSTSLWSPLCITGEPTKALNAYNTVKDIAEEVDDVVAEFQFPRQKIYHGLFYGNHHVELKRLSADTGVRINVPDFSAPNSHITLEGKAEDVFRALARFSEVMSDPSYTSYRNAPTLTSRPDGTFQHIVKVPVSIVGLLLFRRGTDANVLFQIRALTNTYIFKYSENGEHRDRAQDKDNIEVNDDSNVEEEPSIRPRKDSNSVETFAVRGSKEDVILASTCLARIVDGEKIYTVMYDLKTQRPTSSYSLHPNDDGNRYHGGRGRGTVDGRGRGGRGGYRSAHADSADDGKWGHVRIPVADDEDSRRALAGRKREDAHDVIADNREDDASSVASGRSGKSGGRGRGGRFGRGRGRESGRIHGGRGGSSELPSDDNPSSAGASSQHHRGRGEFSHRGGRGGRRGGRGADSESRPVSSA